MADLLAIGTAFKTTIEANIPGIQAYDKIPENVLTLPAVIVTPDNSDFDVAFARGTDTHQFMLVVLVAYNHLEVAQNNLNPYVSGSGPLSIRECIFNHRDLGNPGWQAHITRMYDYGMRFNAKYQGSVLEQFGARLSMTVYTSGSS